MSYHCVFLSADGVNPDHVDEHLAVAPLAALGVQVSTRPWDDAAYDWSQADAVIVRSTWDYHARLAEFFAALARIDAATTLANPLAVMRWNSRKTYLRELSEAGIATVDTEFGQALDQPALAQLAARFGHGQWIVKPQVGANSSDVFRLAGAPSPAECSALLETYQARGFLAQPFVPSVLDPGEYSVFFFDGQPAHALLKTPASGDFRVQEDYGGDIRVIDPPQALLAAARRVHDALPEPCLYVRVDLVATADDGYALMEVELIEPSLYLRKTHLAPQAFARAVRRWLDRQRRT